MEQTKCSSRSQVQIQQQQQQNQSKKKSKNKKRSSKIELNTVTKATVEQQLHKVREGVVAENGLTDQLKQQLCIGTDNNTNVSNSSSSSCRNNNKVSGLMTENFKKSNKACPANTINNTCNEIASEEHKQNALNGHHVEQTSVVNGDASPEKQAVNKKLKRKCNKKNPCPAEGDKSKLENGYCSDVNTNGFSLQEQTNLVNETKPNTAINTINIKTSPSHNITNTKAECSQQKAKEQKTQEQESTPLLSKSQVASTELDLSNVHIEYKEYESELQMHDIMRLIQAELSEPYSIYTYRYFIYNWPKLCFLAAHDNEYVGAIVCKLDMHMNVRRGYIAMLAVRKEYRKLKIGTTLVQKAIEAMLADKADEVVLETEMSNLPALRLYENLGFVRDKRLFRYYLNGVDALRLKLWFR